jgi:hypothetical protein
VVGTVELLVSFVGGSVVGAFVGGWLGRWTEREKPLRELMTSATSEFADAISGGIAVLAKDQATGGANSQVANDQWVRAVGTLGRLHVLFHETTYQQAEEAVAALGLAASGHEPVSTVHDVERAYRHLRAFADCAGSEIRRPSGITRRYGALSSLPAHVDRQMRDDPPPPPSPLMESIRRRR